jgi:hypothetical protein
MMAAIVAPAGVRSIAMMRSCLVSGPSAGLDDAGAGRLRETALAVFRAVERLLPETRVAAPVERRRPRTPPQRQVVRNPPPPAAPSPEQVQAAANRQVVQQTRNFDQRRDNVILPKTGASTYELTQRDIENIPRANAIQLSDLVLQFPGVYQDSTSQGDFHIRNEHGNVQYRINGILLPDGVSGFSQILETSFIGNMQLLTGALPAR